MACSLSWRPWPAYRWRGRGTVGPSPYLTSTLILRTLTASKQHQAAQSRRSEAPARNGHGCSRHFLATCRSCIVVIRNAAYVHATGCPYSAPLGCSIGFVCGSHPYTRRTTTTAPGPVQTDQKKSASRASFLEVWCMGTVGQKDLDWIERAPVSFSGSVTTTASPQA